MFYNHQISHYLNLYLNLYKNEALLEYIALRNILSINELEFQYFYEY